MNVISTGLVLVCLVSFSSIAHSYTPEVNYVLHCQGCHFDDGRANADEVPALNEIGMFLNIEGGREYLIQVPGVASAPITDHELTELMNWVVSRFANAKAKTFKPYATGEVQQLRLSPLIDATKTREQLLNQSGE